MYPIRFLTIDPAGKDKGSDDNGIGVHYLKEDRMAGTATISRGKWDPQQVITEALKLAIEYRSGIIFCEATAYQSTLAFWMEKAIEDAHLDIKVIPIHTGLASKFKRIKAWVKLLATGKWDISSIKAYNLLTFQIYGYRTNKKYNADDLLDVCAQAVLAINKYGTDIVASADRVTGLQEKHIPVVIRDNSRGRTMRRALQ
jgi:hypothetical protein